MIEYLAGEGLSVIIEIVVLCVGIGIFVGKINGLTRAIENLSSSVERMSREHQQTRERVLVLETKITGQALNRPSKG